MQATQAAQDLSDQLHRQADQRGFTNILVNAGPFVIRLRTDLNATRLQLATAFELTQITQDCQPDLTVYVVCASDESGPTIAKLLAPFLAASPMGLTALAHRELASFVVMHDFAHKLLKTYDASSRTAVLYMDDPALLPSWERFSPIKEFIHLLALSQSCLLLHAGSVVSKDNNRSVLLVGPGGSGKSSLTAFAVTQGMRTNGDDYVLIDLRQIQPRCWSIYRTLKLHPSSPAAALTHRLVPWQVDSLTQKTIYLGSDDLEDNCFATRTHIARIYGLTLRTADPDIKRGKRVDPHRNPYTYCCMSTIQQIPYWVGSTLHLSKQLHQSVGYRALTVNDGVTGMGEALRGIVKDMNG
jgi:hypothetical protein